MIMDETLLNVSERVKNFAVIYLVDITEVPDFNKASPWRHCCPLGCPVRSSSPLGIVGQMYELYDPCTVMFFYRNKHIMIDLGTGNNNKINVRRILRSLFETCPLTNPMCVCVCCSGRWKTSKS
jgi:U5 snRNP protein, DIM1 family